MAGAKESLCEPGTGTEEVQLRRVVRRVLLVTSPGLCHAIKVNISPDCIAI